MTATVHNLPTPQGKPSILSVIPENIPDQLKVYPQFVNWKLINRDGKLTKPPFQASGGLARVDDPETWSTFEEAEEAYREKKALDGVGFVFTADDPFTVFDFDDCVDDDGVIDRSVEKIIDTIDSYTELSPSGRGVRVIAKGKKPGMRCKNVKLKLEIYDHSRFATLTGHIIAGRGAIEDRQDEIETAYRMIFDEEQTGTASTGENTSSPLVEAGKCNISLDEVRAIVRHSVVWPKIKSLEEGDLSEYGGDQSSADLALLNYYAFFCQRDPELMDEMFRDTALYRPKWDEQRGEKTYGELTIAKAIEGTQEVYNPEKNRSLCIFTDMRVAQAFADLMGGKIRYFQESRKWIVYDNTRWTTDAPGGPFPLLKEVIKGLRSRLSEINDPDDLKKAMKQLLTLESHKKQVDIINAASKIPALIVFGNQLDADPWLLNCQNGTLDLKTGELRDHRPDDLITRQAPVEYDPDAQCPLFLKFLDRIFDWNPNLIKYLQRFIGYCLTGLTIEQILLFFYGTGKNGKSVLLNVILALLGDYASTAGSGLLMSRDGRAATNDIAGLRGNRVVSVSEFDEGEKIAEAQVKTLTGGDAMACRFLYGEFFSYVPTFKIILAGNHKPRIRGRDLGIWRRFHLVPFSVTIPEEERDPQLFDKLKSELPGIMAWAVRGCLDWQKQGINPPQEVLAGTEEYRRGEDIFQNWLDDECVQGIQYQETTSALLFSFKSYSGWKNISIQKFGRMLREGGFEKGDTGTARGWSGLALKDSTEGFG